MVANTVSMNSAVSREAPRRGRSSVKAGPAAYGYAAAALAGALGWAVTRQYQLFDPEAGAGYWLGIVGASLMATLLLYPLRKRLGIMRKLGATRHWFRMHMIFGVLGPLLILYHCNFQLGSLNSNVALVCTLLVAGSGLIGRYLYTKVYSDLDGHRRSLQELANRARLTPQQKVRAGAVAPHLIERMTRFDALVLKSPDGLLASIVLPARLAVTTRIGFLCLAFTARREIRRQAARVGVSKAQRGRAQSAVTSLIAAHLRAVRRVAEFHSYERLFSLWHVFHLPFFYILVLTAVLHVVAVHMY
jgi:hypothetical protein